MLKFYSVLPDLTKNFPIKLATIKDWKWYQRMFEDLKSQDPRPVMHTARCPGILEICNHGWIQYTYQEIVVETIGDGSSFYWHSEIDQHNLEPFGELLGPYLGLHPPNQFMDFNQFRVQTLQSIVKINSPWFVQIPEQHSLLVLPVPYPDNNVFSAAPGMLRGTSSMNVQLFWHNLCGCVTVPRGTPLCHYFLIPDIDESFSVVDATVDTWNEIKQNLVDDINRRYRHNVNVPEVKSTADQNYTKEGP